MDVRGYHDVASVSLSRGGRGEGAESAFCMQQVIIIKAKGVGKSTFLYSPSFVRCKLS